MNVKYEFSLVDKRAGGLGLIFEADDCNKLAEWAEKLGLKKELKKLGHCWNWNWGELIELDTYEMRTDNIKLAPGVYFERVIKWYKE